MFTTIIIQIIGSYLATVAFAIITNVPRKTLHMCGLTGLIGWMTFWIFQNFQVGIGMASMAGAFMVAVCSHFCAKYKKMPITIFNIPGLVPLVPGGIAYQAVRSFVLGNYVEAIGFTVQVGVVAGAIAAGIMISEIFNRSIRHFRENKEQI